MALKAIYESIDDVLEPLREHVVEKDGKFVLDVDGYVAKDTLNQFRTNNRVLNREKEQLQKDLEMAQAQLTEVQAKYKDIDLDEYKTLKDAPTDIQRQLAESEARLKMTYDKNYGERIAQLEADNKAKEQKFQMEKIKSEVARLGPGLGVKTTSIHNLQRDAAEVFAIIDDQPVPLHKGEPLYSEKSPSRFMDMAEWIPTQVPVNPDYFESSSGGGANGGLGGVSRNGHRVIPASDSRAILNNLEAVASGKMEVDLSA
jgi:hypothetical protein